MILLLSAHTFTKVPGLVEALFPVTFEGIMDTQGSTLNSPGHDDTYKIVFFPATDAVEADKELNAITSEKDETSQITLNTANAIPEPVQSQSTELVTKQPGVEPCMKPENYVIKPEYLEEAPDFIDCPYCKTRQKTEVRHQPTSQTKYVALSTNQNTQAFGHRLLI